MTGDYWYLEHFWHKFANSAYIALATMVLTMLIGSILAGTPTDIKRLDGHGAPVDPHFSGCEVGREPAEADTLVRLFGGVEGPQRVHW